MDNKENAETREKIWQTQPGHRIYTDGSDCDGGVGALAVLYKQGETEPIILRYHLGNSSCHSIYEAEIVGLILGAYLLLQMLSVNNTSCTADNRPCLLAIQNRHPHLAHYLIDRLLDSLHLLKQHHPDIKLTFWWVPGRRNLDGMRRRMKRRRRQRAERAVTQTSSQNG